MNLMIGTDPSGKGGIASVVSLLISEGFLDKYHIKYVASHAEGNSFKKLDLFIRAIFAIVKTCDSAKPSVVHVHSASHASFIRKSVLLGLARALRCKTLFHLHGGGFDRYAQVESGWLMRWWIRRTLVKSTKLIALTDEWATFLSNYAPQANVCVIPNSVQLPTLDNAVEEDGRILFLGRPEAHKGIFELLSAVALLKPSWPAIKLIIAGEGDLEAVRHRAEQDNILENIELLGWIEAERRQHELSRACIFALPSYAEGLPMAMLEAMAAGKAVIVTAVGGMPGVVDDQLNGLVIAPRDVTQLTAALEKLLSNNALRKSLGVNARRTIEQRFGNPVVFKKLFALYDELCIDN